MNKILIVGLLVLSMLLTGPLAFGNPGMLPKHPGYPMGEFKDPVMGVPTANDPGRPAPSRDEAVQQASEFHDAHAKNARKEVRPNIVYELPTPQGGSSDEKAKP